MWSSVEIASYFHRSIQKSDIRTLRRRLYIFFRPSSVFLVSLLFPEDGFLNQILENYTADINKLLHLDKIPRRPNCDHVRACSHVVPETTRSLSTRNSSLQCRRFGRGRTPETPALIDFNWLIFNRSFVIVWWQWW